MFEKFGVEVNKKLDEFYNIHLNATLNLTSIKGRQDFYIKHYLDSIYYFEKITSRPSGSVVDIGSGGGFPGVVLAICYPELKVTLVDSIKKKCDFLEDAVKQLKLTNVDIINDRAENIKNKRYDIITVRGVATVKELLKYLQNIFTDKTKLILYKGERLEDELKEAEKIIKLRGFYVETYRVEEEFKRSYCIITHSSGSNY